MSFLEQALIATEARGRGPVILSEQHDVTRINFVAGMSDPGEMIRCGYRPELRRKAGEQDAAYAERIYPLVMALPQEERDIIMNAAIRRAGYDLSNGRVNVMVAGEAPWARLGVHIESATDSENACRLSGLAGWNMEKVATYFQGRNGLEVVPGRFAIVRGDTGACLASVGSDYQIEQCEVKFKFLDAIAEEFGARYVTAGSVDGGRKVWMQIEIPSAAFVLPGNDENRAYGMFVDYHGTGDAAIACTTGERAVCKNSMRMALTKAGKVYKIRHTGKLMDKVEDARVAMGLGIRKFQEYKEHAEVFVRTKCEQPEEFFHGLLDTVLEMTRADALKGADVLAASLAVTEAEQARIAKQKQREIDRRENMVEDMLNRWESRTNGIGGMRDSLWGVLNASTEHADHYQAGRKHGTVQDREGRRFESVLVGAADDMKQAAYAQALTLAS